MYVLERRCLPFNSTRTIGKSRRRGQALAVSKKRLTTSGDPKLHPRLRAQLPVQRFRCWPYVRPPTGWMSPTQRTARRANAKYAVLAAISHG